MVVDNVSFHKVAGVEETIQAGGAELRYLPQYSPEFNPIELVFHPLKASLRKAAERTIEGWSDALARSFERSSQSNGYFRHAGYERYEDCSRNASPRRSVRLRPPMRRLASSTTQS